MLINFVFNTDKVLTSKDIAQLTDLLYPAAIKWYELGLQLGVSVGRLREIDYGCRRSSRCLTEMLTSWVSGTQSTTVRNLVDALRRKSVNEEKLAAEVIEVFC